MIQDNEEINEFSETRKLRHQMKDNSRTRLLPLICFDFGTYDTDMLRSAPLVEGKGDAMMEEHAWGKWREVAMNENPGVLIINVQVRFSVLTLRTKI